MSSTQRRLFLTAALLGLAGCGPGGPKTYPVTGKVVLAGGDVAQLAGSHVEASLAGDPDVRASGEIRPDGGFALVSLHAGAVRKGAREGAYQVRLLLADDDPATRRRAAKAVAARFLRFDTSGLSLQVPASGDVTLQVSPR
jgi:hypothetical protein